MLILELAAGILPGVVIVFSGVWMVLYWRVIDAARKRALSIAMATSLIVILIGFLRIASMPLIIAVVVILFMTAAFGVARGSNGNARSLWTPGLLATMLYKPLACFFGIAAVLSTVALFATMQHGPQPDLPVFELSGIAAACWALIMVGGVWAKKNMRPSRKRAQRRDAANRYGQSPFRKFPG